MPQLADSGIRPYRSHKIRACDLCRRRKSRCVLDVPGNACVMCRVAGVHCCYVSQNIPDSRGDRRCNRAVERRRRSTTDVLSPQCAPTGPRHEPDTNLETLVDGDSELTRIVGPLISDDAKIVQQHCAPETTTAGKDSQYRIFSDDIAEPVLYMKAARRHPGFQSSAAAGVQQRIIMEQILGDCAEDLINIYFEKIHPSFPILDRSSLHDIQTHHTVSCEIYAISLLYWDTPNTGGYPRPDANYFWNLAVTALKEEFSNPGLSTIPCALIDLMGRPSLWMAGNAINSGRTVALAHTIGLNRDPRKWKIKKAEQDLRIRLWWGIVIHDRWASFAHGVPPSIVKANYDVALPCMEDIMLVCDSSDKQRSSVEIFISLCGLSEVLGDILPLVYDLHVGRGSNLAKQLKYLDVYLDNWEDSLPQWLQGSLNKPLTPVIPGCSNFQLSALSVKLLLHRIRLHDATSRAMSERAAFYRSECIESALAIVNFTTALHSNHRQDFWLPYAAYHLSSATMLLLRCALEAGDTKTKDACISNAKRLIEYLDKARDQDDWDIGSVCLLHCKASISRLMASQSQSDVTALPGNVGAIPSQFYPGSSWESIGLYDLDDAMLDDFRFDLDDIWNEFCSPAQ